MTEYLVILQKGESNWGAYVPDVPGCVAVAKTREEIEKLIQEALILHLDLMRRDGDPIPIPTTEAIRVAV